MWRFRGCVVSGDEKPFGKKVILILVDAWKSQVATAALGFRTCVNNVHGILRLWLQSMKQHPVLIFSISIGKPSSSSSSFWFQTSFTEAELQTMAQNRFKGVMSDLLCVRACSHKKSRYSGQTVMPDSHRSDLV